MRTGAYTQPVRQWQHPGGSRIPYWAYTDDAVYQRELERLFYQAHWCYVGLEAEIPNLGDFKRTKVGERSVILIRDKDGGINVVENRWAHRGKSGHAQRPRVLHPRNLVLRALLSNQFWSFQHTIEHVN